MNKSDIIELIKKLNDPGIDVSFEIDTVTPVSFSRSVVELNSKYISKEGSSWPREGDVYRCKRTEALFFTTRKENGKVIELMCIKGNPNLEVGDGFEYICHAVL